MAKFEASGRVCVICREPVAEEEPVDIEHLTPWADMHCQGKDPDVINNLGVAHRWCNQAAGRLSKEGWTPTRQQHAELQDRLERYLATLEADIAAKHRWVFRRLPTYKRAELLTQLGVYPLISENGKPSKPSGVKLDQ